MQKTFKQAIREKFRERQKFLIDGINVTQKTAYALQDYADWILCNDEQIGMIYQPSIDEMKAQLKGQAIGLNARLQVYAYSGLEIGNEGGYKTALTNIHYDMDRTLHGDDDGERVLSAIERGRMEAQVDECTKALSLFDDALSGTLAEIREKVQAESGTAATV